MIRARAVMQKIAAAAAAAAAPAMTTAFNSLNTLLC